MRNCDRPEIKHFDEEDESLYERHPGQFPRLYTQRDVSDMLLLQTMLNEDVLTDRVLDPWTNLGAYRQIKVIRMLLEVERGQ